jgi:hypothetical protein
MRDRIKIWEKSKKPSALFRILEPLHFSLTVRAAVACAEWERSTGQSERGNEYQLWLTENCIKRARAVVSKPEVRYRLRRARSISIMAWRDSFNSSAWRAVTLSGVLARRIIGLSPEYLDWEIRDIIADFNDPEMCSWIRVAIPTKELIGHLL